MSIFHVNDIRGIFNVEWNETDAYAIGRVVPAVLGIRNMVVGRDARTSTETVFAEFTRGLRDSGANVTSIGLCDTPAVYFAVGKIGFDGGAMITASHNPPEYNGIKLVGPGSSAVGYDNGISEIEQLCADYRSGKDVFTSPKQSGKFTEIDITEGYVEFYRPFMDQIGPIRTVIDCSHGTAAVFGRQIMAGTRAQCSFINDKPDGTFPVHGPDPMNTDNLIALGQQVREEGAHLGMCFDGDGDRVVLVDENGKPVGSDLLLAVLARYYLEKKPETIVYDLRCSNGVPEYIAEHGGTALMSPVGHVSLKRLIKETGSVFGGELSGHYYFRDFFSCDSAWLTALLVLSVLSQTDTSLSEIIRSVDRYENSGEINFPVARSTETIYRNLKYRFQDGSHCEIDGLRIDYPDWWFIVRPSTNEPLVRLVVESRNKQTLQSHIAEVSSIITGTER